MLQEQMLRLSELTKLSRLRPLTEAEQAERASLRQQYIDGFRANMECVLQNVMIREDDGTLHPLEKKPEPKDDPAADA